MIKVIKLLGISGALLVGGYLGLLGATIADAHVIPCGTYDPNYGYGTCDDHGNPTTVYEDPGTPGGSVYINYGNSNANNTNSSTCQNSSGTGGYSYDAATGTYTLQNPVSNPGCSAVNSNTSGVAGNLPWGNAPVQSTNSNYGYYHYHH